MTNETSGLPENATIEPAPIQENLTHSQILSGEILDEGFMRAIAKLRTFALPVHQRIAVKDFYARLEYLHKEIVTLKNEIIEEYGEKDEKTGNYTVKPETLEGEKQSLFMRDWNEFISTKHDTQLKERFILPASALMSVDDEISIQRFIKV